MYRSFSLKGDSKKDKKNKSKLRCWICQKNRKGRSWIKNKAFSKKLNLVKSKKHCFNCLSNTDTISNCISKISCKAKGCQKKHRTLLHPTLVNKTSSVPLRYSDSPP